MANIIEHLQNKEFTKVLQFCEQSLQTTPDDYNLVIVKGWCLYELEQYSQAEAVMQRWPEAKGSLHIFTVGLAQDYFFLKEDYSQVIALSTSYLDQHPNNATLYSHLALAYGTLGLQDKSIEAFYQLLALESNPKAELNLATLLLNQYRYEEGLALYESRLKAFDHFDWFLKNTHMPFWQGESLAGKHIVLWTEQGLGDTLQFCRFASVLAKQGAKVSLLLHGPHRSLRKLLETLEGVDGIYTTSKHALNLPDNIDYHCPLLGVMHRLKLRQETIPATVPYLSALTSHHQRWQKLAQTSKKKIGIVWQTQTNIDSQNLRQKLGGGQQSKNIPLEELRPLFSLPNIQWFSLQYPVAGEDKALMQTLGIFDTSNLIRDFSDTAAIIEHMDMVVTIDTSVAHLAGALAKPTITLLPFVNDWRWEENRDDSPWYPTMTLLRQQQRGQWAEVVEALLALLHKG